MQNDKTTKIETATLPESTVPKIKLPKLEVLSIHDFELNIDYYLKNVYNDIFTASSELPAIIEWVNTCLQDYTEAKMEAKDSLEEAKATEYLALKGGGFLTKYNYKPTEEAIASAVTVAPEVVAAKAKYRSLYAWVGRLHFLISSLQSKLEMVRSSESTRRVFTADSRTNED